MCTKETWKWEAKSKYRVTAAEIKSPRRAEKYILDVERIRSQTKALWMKLGAVSVDENSGLYKETNTPRLQTFI